MFKAKIDNSQKIFTNCIQAIKTITDEACLDISSDRISTKAIDPSNTCMIELSISSNVFSEFSVSDPIQLPVDISKLLKFVEKMITAIDIELDEEKHKLNLNTERLHYGLPLLAPDSLRKPPKIPNLDDGYYDIQITGAEYKEFIDAVSSIGNYIYLGVKDGIFFAEGMSDSDFGTVKYEIPDVPAPNSRCMYSLGYLEDFVKIFKSLNSVRLSLRTDYPLKIFFSFAENVNGMYLLAPRVETD